MSNETKKILEAYQRIMGEEISLEEAKGKYIPKARRKLEETFGTYKVKEIFGEMSNLEKAEILLFQLKNNEITEDIREEALIGIAKAISLACGDSKNEELIDKYNGLYSAIPIQILYPGFVMSPIFSQIQIGNLAEVTTSSLEKSKAMISAKTLREMRTESKTSQSMKLYFAYILGVAQDSLEKIFDEVKSKIMGE